jgi:phosphohistidine phosphatase
MKRILLVRHAKAEDGGWHIDDFDRQLVKKGVKRTRFMAELLKDRGETAGFMVSSPAPRALGTARGFAKVMGYPVEEIREEELLYDYFTTNDILKIISETDEKHHTVSLFGHNPTLSDLACRLAPDFNTSMPKTAVLAIDFACNKWDGVKAHEGTIAYYEYPKKHK